MIKFIGIFIAFLAFYSLSLGFSWRSLGALGLGCFFILFERIIDEVSYSVRRAHKRTHRKS